MALQSNLHRIKTMPQSSKPTQDQPGAAHFPQTVSHMLGEIVWLMTQSPLHRHFALADLEWMLMPPLLLNQYRVFHENGRPVGVALWAYLSESAEAKLSLPLPRLRADEWKSGERCWLVDLVAPFADEKNRAVNRMLTDLRDTALTGRIFRFIVTNPTTGVRDVVALGNQSEAL